MNPRASASRDLANHLARATSRLASAEVLEWIVVLPPIAVVPVAGFGCRVERTASLCDSSIRMTDILV
jgi:hypothetical protein